MIQSYRAIEHSLFWQITWTTWHSARHTNLMLHFIWSHTWHSHLWPPVGLYNSNIPAASETENVFSSLRHTSPRQPLLWPRASFTLWAWIYFNDSHTLNFSWQRCVRIFLSQPSYLRRRVNSSASSGVSIERKRNSSYCILLDSDFSSRK